MREPRETGGNARSCRSNWTSRHTPVSFVMRKVQESRSSWRHKRNGAVCRSVSRDGGIVTDLEERKSRTVNRMRAILYKDETNELSHTLLLPGFTALREGVSGDPAREAMTNGNG
jgi:hypothetical protein